MPLELDLLPPEEHVPEPPPPKTLVVRFGYLREIGEFPSDLTQRVPCGSKLIVRTERGTEIAVLLTTTCSAASCPKAISREQLLAYIEKSGSRHFPFTEQGRILRLASSQDLLEQCKLDENRTKHLAMARDLVGVHKLAMKVVDVEHLLGGERILFYFVSEHRVDFRSLVRDLAHNLHTRIELRQVGARDEARLAGDFEKCGQHCCCRQFLKVLAPISMRAAKIQKATLDPTKISGRCGRLMCCLRYEDKTYDELRKKLPKRNTRVATEKGDAWVVDGQILTQLVLCQFDDGTREAIPVEKITAFDRPKPVLPDGRIMQTPNDRPPMVAGDMPPRRNGATSQSYGTSNGAPSQGRARRGGPGTASADDSAAPAAPTDGPTVDERSLSALDDDFDDLLADAMDDAPPPASPEMPPDSAPPVVNQPAAHDRPNGPGAGKPSRPMPGQQAARPPHGGNPPRQNQPPRSNRPFQQQKGPRGPQSQPPRNRGPQGNRPPQPQRQPFRPPQPQPNQRHPGQPPAQTPPAAPPARPPRQSPPPESSPMPPGNVAPQPPLAPAPAVPPPPPSGASADASSPPESPNA